MAARAVGPLPVSQPDGADGRFNIDRAQLAHDLTATHNRWLDLVARLLSGLAIAALLLLAAPGRAVPLPEYTDTHSNVVP